MSSADEKHPIVAGFIALVSVTAAVGIIVGLAAVVGTHVLHIGGASATPGAQNNASMFVPMPSPTQSQSGPLVTLAAGPSQATSSGPAHSPSSSKSSKSDQRISLSASVVSAGPMQQFDITGTFATGEGHILRLQRRSPGGAWADFGVPDMDVQGGQFSTGVQTGHTGANDFRVKDVDTGKLSNTVTVTIG